MGELAEQRPPQLSTSGLRAHTHTHTINKTNLGYKFRTRPLSNKLKDKYPTCKASLRLTNQHQVTDGFVSVKCVQSPCLQEQSAGIEGHVESTDRPGAPEGGAPDASEDSPAHTDHNTAEKEEEKRNRQHL